MRLVRAIVADETAAARKVLAASPDAKAKLREIQQLLARYGA